MCEEPALRAGKKSDPGREPERRLDAWSIEARSDELRDSSVDERAEAGVTQVPELVLWSCEEKSGPPLGGKMRLLAPASLRTKSSRLP